MSEFNPQSYTYHYHAPRPPAIVKRPIRIKLGGGRGSGGMRTPSGTAIAVLLGGAVLVYSGVNGSGISDTIRAFIAGKQPTPVPFTLSGGIPDASGTASAAAVIAKAQSQIGKPYIFASPASLKTPNPKGFDCSGLCGWSYYQGAGISLVGHNTNAYYAQLAKKPISQVAAGDFVYFGNAVDKPHMALYVGNNQIIEAPQTGIPVRMRDLNNGQAPYKYCTAFPGGTVGAGNSATSVEGGAGASGGNQALGLAMAAAYGWTGSEWTALKQLWTRESGWDNHADTRKTGAGGDGPGSSVFAYGISQARPATKLPKAGQPSDLGGISDPESQIRWGLSYIRQRYGSPSVAWQHELANSWY